jgi:electron transfer flavoprotein beta subunit
MRVIVILGRVLDPGGIVVNRRRGRIFINREGYVLQPADRCALEAALCIKDANDGSAELTTGAEVVALPRSLLPDDDVLRQALATGADRAVYLVGQVANPPYDDAAMAGVLAAVVERLGGADLVLTGTATLDTGQAQLGPRLAEALGWPQIIGVRHVAAADGRVQAVLREASGYVTVEADMPAVVTVVPGALKPRYPKGVRLINVYRGLEEAVLEQLDVTELVDAEAPAPLVERRGQSFPPERERGTRASGTPQEMVQVAADALRQRARK